jgi:hypothetical protein
MSKPRFRTLAFDTSEALNRRRILLGLVSSTTAGAAKYDGDLRTCDHPAIPTCG